MSAPLKLPTDIRVHFLAEGNANVIYRLELPQAHSSSPAASEIDIYSQDDDDPTLPSEISPPASPFPHLTPPTTDPTHDIFKTHLLRLRKTVPWLIPAAAQHAALHRHIAPLFPADALLTHHLVRLPPGLIDALNARLAAGEQAALRAPDRHGTYLAADTHGTLVLDMRAAPDADQVALDFKPKWLVQSPSAPPGSRRCRTCALAAMRGKPGPAAFCPLDLASGERAALERALAAMPALRAEPSDVRARVADVLLASGVLAQLRDLQRKLDPVGVLALARDEVPDGFLVATTLRDCTLYVRVGRDGGMARLGDLDVKLPGKGKLSYWKGVERGLIEGGWYEGREVVKVRTGCRLERSDRT